MRSMWILLVAAAACGDNNPGRPALDYTNPEGGKLRLVRDPKATPFDKIVLDFIVGDQPVMGYAVGFDLPLDAKRVMLGTFTPGSALPEGTSAAAIPTTGPLAAMLVTAQSQTADKNTADTMLAAKDVLYTIELDLVAGATEGVVFDGQAMGFVLPSGGMLDRAGTGVVLPSEVAIGKLAIVLR